MASRLAAVEERISAAARRVGRERSDITLVAVTKKFSAATVQEAYHAGLRHFGENYVQEFAGKRPELAGLPEARYHLIGHLQTNKVKLAADLFETIETVDSVRLLERLERSGRDIEAYIEVKLSDEESKTGAAVEDVPAIAQAAQGCAHVRLVGLMTVPPWSTDAEQSRLTFRRLAALARELKLPKLSMGMSNDFEVAIEEGATSVRVGTALFGARPKV